jgi:prolyl-tRNA editing enzyme YbaK/EbsC (Cys-tRNA(Pro) deacylase)
VFEGRTLVFTAGSRSRSIRMATEDYRRVARPQVVPFVR